MKRGHALLLTLLLPLACDTKDDSGDDVAETTGETTTGETTTGETGETGETTQTGETGGPEDFPPVECGDVMCVEGQLCVMPSETCDYDQNPPVWVQDPSVCLDVPPSCFGLVDDALVMCLNEGLCTSGEELPASLADGVLDCPANGGDCF